MLSVEFSLSEGVWNFQNNALWDTHKHALIAIGNGFLQLDSTDLDHFMSDKIRLTGHFLLNLTGTVVAKYVISRKNIPGKVTMFYSILYSLTLMILD